MTEHHGVVTLGDDSVDVTVALADGRVRLSAGSNEIGDWSAGDCRLAEHEDGMWVIEAENESLPFRPADPTAFAMAARPVTPESAPAEAIASTDETAEPAALERPGRHRDPEAPKATTVIGFYALAATTAVLGLWALLNLLG